MPRGSPDYLVLQTQTIRQTVSQEYLSAFDIGFSRFDGGGRVLWFDDFTSGVGRSVVAGNGGGASPYLTFDNGKRFGMSGGVVLDPVLLNGQSVISNYFTLPASGNIGFEAAIYFPQNFGRASIEFGGAVLGDNFVFGTMYFEEGTGKVYLSVSGGTQLVYTPNNINSFQDHYIAFKLLYNPSTGEYKSLLIGSEFIDLSGIYSDDGGILEDGTVFYSVSCFGKAGGKVEPVYLGYVIISADEP